MSGIHMEQIQNSRAEALKTELIIDPIPTEETPCSLKTTGLIPTLKKNKKK